MLNAIEATDALVDSARNGDDRALEQLLSAVAPAIHRFGLRMCKSDPDAQDVLQETLLAIATNLGRFEGRASLSSWVFALTRSACARRRRGQKSRPHLGQEVLESQSADTPSPEQSASDREMGAALTRALDALPDEYREAIVLRDVEGLTAAQAAAALDISVDALKSRLHRARDTLRKALMPLIEPQAPSVPSPGCPDVATLWSRKLEDELNKHDCAEIEKHVEGCPACGAICDALKQALLACQLSATHEVEPEVQARVKAAMRAWAARKTASR
jgi:RNA polymerase sigma-70 factor (ECF subfamily)